MPNPLLDKASLKNTLCPSTTIDAWVFTDTELKEAIQGKRLLSPSIDLSNACNLNCPYCFVENEDSLKKKKLSNELTFEELEAVIHQFELLGARTVNIIGAGDPLVDPRFPEVVKLIRDKGMKVLVATNGIELLRKHALITLLRDVDASIVLKLNSFHESIEDVMVGKRGYTKKRNQVLDILIEKGFNRSTPSHLGINTVITHGNQNEILNIHRYCRERNICFIAGKYMPTGRTESSEFRGHAVVPKDQTRSEGNKQMLLESVENETLASLFLTMRNWDKAHGFQTVENPAYVSGLPCTQSLGVYVDVEGNIWPCPTKKKLVGNALVGMPLSNIRQGIGHIRHTWESASYIQWYRNNYTGGCIYKPISPSQNLS